MPAALENCCVHATSVAMAREDTRSSDSKNVDKVATRNREKKRSEPNVWCLWDPEALVAFKVEDSWNDKVVRNSGKTGTSIWNSGLIRTFFELFLLRGI